MGAKRTRDEDDAEEAFPRGGSGSGGDDLPRGGNTGGGGGGSGKKRSKKLFDDEDGGATAWVAGAKKVGDGKFVELLKYKNLRVGMKVLGVVTEVNDRGLTVSLPNGLKGTVTRAEASDVLAPASKRGKKGSYGNESSEASESESESEEEDEDEDERLDLTSMFQVGQILRCKVRQLGKGKSGGKRIDLSTRLSQVCSNISGHSLTDGMAVPACVNSVEDHGYVLSFGCSDSPTGFLPRKSCPQSLVDTLVRGSILDVVIAGDEGKDGKRARSKGPGGVMQCTADPKRVAQAVTHEGDGAAMSTLLPGMLVNARVKAVLADGLQMNFMTYFTATVDAFHVGGGVHGAAPDPAAAHKTGERVRARVLYVDAATKRVGLTLRPHLVTLEASARAGVMPKPGSIFETAVVRRVDTAIGVLLELKSEDENVHPTFGYCHISDAADEHLDKLEKRFKVGKKVRARVIGSRAMDSVATVSCKSTVLDQPFLSLEELEPGMQVRGEVVAVEPYGAVVKLAPGVKALCPPNHISDIPGRVTNAKVKEGLSAKFRVVSVDRVKGRAVVTHKKQLIRSELPVVASLDDAAPGTTTHGVVTGVEPYGVFVQLYGNLRGLAGLQDLGLAADQTPQEAFAVGQVVRATVIRSDRGEQKIKLSLAPGGTVANGNDLDGTPGEKGDVGAPEPGTIVESATVKRVDEATGNVQVTLPGGVPGVVTAAQMSDHPLTGAGLSQAFAPGDEIGPLVALEAKPRRSILSRKASLVEAARGGTLPEDISGTVVGAVYPGYVASATANAGVFVRFLGRLTGLAPPSQLTDVPVAGGIDPEEMFALGQTVLARVVSVDATVEPPRLSLSLAPRGVAASSGVTAEAPLIRSIFTDVDVADRLADERAASGAEAPEGFLTAAANEKLKVGEEIKGVVHAVREYGVLVDMPDVDPDAVGLVAFHQLPNANGDNEEPEHPAEGEKISGLVLDVSRREGIVDIGARPSLTGAKVGKKGAKALTTAELKKRKAARAGAHKLEIGSKVTAEVELIKPEYAVFSLPDHGGAIAYASVHLLNRHFNEDEVETERFAVGRKVTAFVAGNAASGSPGDRLLLTVPAAKSNKGAGSGEASAVGAGLAMEGVVKEVQSMQAILTLPNGRKGRLHATELAEGDFPMKKIAVGATLNVVTLGPAGDRGNMLELTVRHSVEESREIARAATDAGGGDGSGAGIAGTAALATLSEGDEIDGIVSAVSADTLAIAVAPGLTARVPKIETGDSIAALRKALTSRFTVGERVKMTALAADVARKKIIVTLRSADKRNVVEGAKIAGIVSKIAPGGGGVFVQLNSRQHGRVHVTDIADDPRSEPWKLHSVGEAVEVRVLGVGEGGEVDLSMKSSALKSKGSSNSISSVSQLAPGAHVSGFVKQVNKGGCFVAISRSVDARVKMCNLADTFVSDPAQEFPKGKLVKGTILSVDESSGRAEMTLRSDGMDAAAGRSQIDNNAHVEEGSVQMGTVRRVQTYGVFVTLDGSGRSGLCHISMFADARIKDSLEQHVRAGERVRVKVLQVDEETGKISLGMKPSLFADDEMPDGDAGAGTEEDPLMADEDEETEEEDDDDDDSADEAEEEEEIDDDDEDAEDDESDEDDDESDEEGADVLEGDDDVDMDSEDGDDMDEDDEGEDDSDDEDDEDSDDEDSEDDEKGAVDEDIGFDWDDDKNAKDEEDEEEDADEGPKSKSKSKRERAKEKVAKELELHRKEQALRDKADAAPETAQDFEKLIMSSPRSSYVWLRYMAFQMSVGAYDEARSVAERALKAIPADDEDERMNVWVAYLNLENLHGKPSPREALLKLFDRATKVANPKKLHLTLAGIYERSGQDDMSAQTLKTATRRFGQSAKVWLAHIRAQILHVGDKNADPESVRKALDRATQSLPKRKHVKVLVQTALIEIREGSVERGRTMFESILRNYPKRTDIWSTYIDQEIKQGDPDRTRSLLERATHLDLNPKSMKFLFKRYLNFEREVGDKQRIAHVKQRAMDYVAQKFG